LPHAETCAFQKPKRSATAERNPAPSESRKNSLIIFTFIMMNVQLKENRNQPKVLFSLTGSLFLSLFPQNVNY
jgi:hypothetical protein